MCSRIWRMNIEHKAFLEAIKDKEINMKTKGKQ